MFWPFFTWIAVAPNLGAGTVDNDPKKDPIGVLAALTITTSFSETLLLNNRFCIAAICKNTKKICKKKNNIYNITTSLLLQTYVWLSNYSQHFYSPDASKKLNEQKVFFSIYQRTCSTLLLSDNNRILFNIHIV